jgi:hypothetical protein
VAAPSSSSVREPRQPVDGDHALRIGWVAGALAAAVHGGVVLTSGVEILDDAEGTHLDTLRVTAPSGAYLVTITKESPS